MNEPKKRVTMKLKHPNPLFEKWLIEWRDEAKRNKSKLEHCYAKALVSLKKYPLPLERGRDCKILNGFGDKLCRMLDDKLEGRNNKQPEEDPDETIEYVPPEDINPIPKRKINRNQSQKAAPLSPKRKKVDYVPAYRSGPYAILVTLYENHLINDDDVRSMTKNDIIEKAHRLCDTSFTKSDNGSYYTAWSSMKTLLEKELVKKLGNPARFSLTVAGNEIGRKLYEENVTDTIENRKKEKQFVKDSREEFNAIDLDVCSKPSHSSNVNENIVTNFETVIFPPHTFQVLLVVDKHETAGSKEKLHNDPILRELTNLDVPSEIKHLKVGDYAWICRDNSSNTELVLPYVVERKRMDDFGSSIKDGRYHEQKFRLKQCGIQNVIYLVESYGDNQHIGLPLTTLHQAATNTLIQDGFRVKFSEGIRGTAQYLNCMTKLLKENYESKTVMSCPRLNLEESRIDDDLIPLMTFEEFNQSGSKYKNFTASEMFIKHLVQLKGVSIDKALAIVEKYPTVKSLKEACKEDIENCEKEISNIQFGKKKKIGPAIASTLSKFYTLNDFN